MEGVARQSKEARLHAMGWGGLGTSGDWDGYLWQELGALACREEKGPERLWRSLKPEFRPAVITTGNHGSFLSKGVEAGRAPGVGDGLRKRGEMKMGY